MMPCIHTRIIDKNNLMVKKFSSNLIDDDFLDTLHLITIEKNRMDWKGHSCQAAEQLLDVNRSVLNRVYMREVPYEGIRKNEHENRLTTTTTKLKKTLHSILTRQTMRIGGLKILKCIDKSVTGMILSLY